MSWNIGLGMNSVIPFVQQTFKAKFLPQCTLSNRTVSDDVIAIE
jgi:hypothetical protein